MAQITSGIRAMLSSPRLYTAFQNLMGARKGWKRFVAEFVRPAAGCRILDIGCGPGDLLTYLPAVEYWGFDLSLGYIAYATEKFAGRGRFQCKILEKADLAALPKFDVVVASGLLHHMDDSQARDLFELAREALIPGGRLLTVDPVFEAGQNLLARYLIAKDRGQNVRSGAGYDALAASVFDQRKVSIRHKRWIPYTHCYMECTRT
jgi:SAM-dependent methyltransferase